MKNRFKIVITLLLSVSFYCCQDITIGYLITENASYTVDSLVIKKVLDIEPPHEVPNPRYYELIEEWGYTPEELANRGIYPTMLAGGGEDYIRNLRNIPWVSTAIEGIEGTEPILASIKEIKTIQGSAKEDEVIKYISVRGDGMFTIPLTHEIPVGRYLITLTFSNEGYTNDVNDCFTLIVK